MVRNHLSCLVGLALLLSAVAAAQPINPMAPYSPGFVWVQFAEGVAVSPGTGKTGLAVFDQVATQFGVFEVAKAFPFIDRVAETRELAASTRALQRIYSVRHDESFDSGLVAAALARDPNVVYAEPRFIRAPAWDSASLEVGINTLPETPNDTLFAQAAYMRHLRMPDAWDVVKGEQGDVVIAVVELGMDLGHEDIRGTLWTNPGEVSNNGIDDDGNGFVDDVHGWDFNADLPIASGSANDDNVIHGIAVAGAASAEADNSIGLAGTSWNAKLMPVAGHGLGIGIMYAALNGADIINASYGGFGYSQTEVQVMHSALDEGALVVAAAGNARINSDYNPTYPANYGIELSVGGTLSGSDVNYYNYGRSVNVYAAGRDVIVPRPGDAYGRDNGTSFASPLVAGIAALVKTANPGFSPHQVREQVRLTADNIDAANDASLAGLLGRGRVNAYRAVTESGFPAIRMTRAQLTGGERVLQSGESAEITATLVNYLAGTQNLTIEWFADGDFVQFDTGPVSVGRLGTGDSTSVTTRFLLTEDTPYRSRLLVSPRARDGSYVDAPDVVRLMANDGETLEHVTGGMGFTISTEGNFGFLDNRFRQLSEGVWVYDTNGMRRSIIHEGGLLVASGPDAVSDCLNSDELRPQIASQHMDWVPQRGASLEIQDPGNLVAQEGRMELVDGGAPNPLGVEVLQESFVDTAAENEDFVILRYTITNPTGAELANIHIGLMFNWQLNSTWMQDYALFDGTRNLGYQQDAASNPTVVVGTMPLSANVPVHFRAFRYGEPLTDQTKWSYLTGGIQSPGSEANDWTQVTGLGPFTIAPGQEVQVAFAVVTGRSREDLFQNADNAKALWEGTLRQAPTAQFIQNIDGPALDVYLDGQRLFDDWAFQSASAFDVLSQGEHTIDVVRGGDGDNAQPLRSQSISVGTATDYHVIAHGKGEDVDVVFVDDVRRSHDVDDQAAFYVTHGARDLEAVDVRLLQPGGAAVVLLDDAAYGTVGSYVSVPPGSYDVEVVAAADQRLVNVFEFDLGGLSRQAFVLSLSGLGTSAREGLTMMGVQADGTVFFPSGVTRTGDQTELPEHFVLHGNYPNPFNPHTTILVDLPMSATVTVEVFDVLGRAVLRSVPEELEAGSLRAIRMDVAQLASGTYPYRVRAATAAGIEVRMSQMTILK